MIKIKIYMITIGIGVVLLSGCGKKQVETTEVTTEEMTTEVSATTEALEMVALKDAEIGDIVQMGTYEQDGDPETEDPICWDVLDKDGDAMLLISHDVIAYQRFSDSFKCVIWEDSQIRSWLNQAFYEEAFDETEQASIRETTLENPSTVGFFAHAHVSDYVQVREGKPDTRDKIFMLNWKEAEQYYGKNLTETSVLQRKPSKVVQQMYEERNTHRNLEGYGYRIMYPVFDVSEGIAWMLRSTGGADNTILVIRGGERYRDKGMDGEAFANSYVGVRPAMWIHVGE